MKYESIYPNAIYRVSAKAVIKKENKILLVNEDGFFELPGGGIDHGESLEVALKRELIEEVGVKESDNFDYKIIGIQQHYDLDRKSWKIAIICEIDFMDETQFSVGVDANELKFFSHDELKQLPNPQVKWARKYGFGEDIEIDEAM